MAHYVARILHLRPNEILDHWGVSELLIAFGQYANEETHKNFLTWQENSRNSKNKSKPPKEVMVKFYHNGEEDE